MTTCDSDTYWQERIATVKALIAAYDAALLAFATTNQQTYSLDTGQTRITVQKANIASVRDTRNQLLNELRELEAMNGCSGSVGVPGWP